MTTENEIKKALDGLNAFKVSFRESFNNLLKTFGQNPSGFGVALEAYLRKIDTDLQTIIVPLNNYYLQLNKAPGTVGTTTASGVHFFVKFANFLDEQGAHYLADHVTELARLFKETEPKMEEQSSIQPAVEASLSTRYCPDHVGVPVVRITDEIYQCMLDGKMYDFGSGFLNYKGQRVSGGSVSAQTPAQSDCGGIPMRVYEPTTSILNRDN